MFGKGKGSSHEKDELLPPAPQLQESTPANLAESDPTDSTEISCIGPGMTVVGKISSDGILNVLGRVEGELRASIVRISDGAQVEGTIAAQELMLDAAYATHRREMEETRAKWLAEVAALRQAASKTSARLTSELQIQKSQNAALQRELDTFYVKLEKANTLIVDQGRKLAAHDEVTDLEKRLLAARRRSAS